MSVQDQILLPDSEVQAKKFVAVVDDAFDDFVGEEITISQFYEFYQVANDNGEFDNALLRNSITLPDIYGGEEYTPEFSKFITDLWNLRQTDEDFKPLVDTTLFVERVNSLNDLDTICQNLVKFDLQIKKIKSTEDDFHVFTNGDYKLIFLDYNLGPQPGSQAILNAQRKAHAIYNACPEHSKPIMVLMSSAPNIANEKDNFQRDADLLEGVFRFSPKSNLSDINVVSLLVHAYLEEFENNHALQSYIMALSKAASEALIKFQTEIRLLHVDDYVFIQNSVLGEQDQPLGDYLAWLYGSHWANLLLKNEELRAKQNIIDKVLSQTPPIHHELPSTKVSDIYMSALFEENLSPISYHPLETHNNVRAEKDQVANLPYLHLGDIFSKKGSKTLWMVLNAQCDLERLRNENSKRSILLLPGHLHPLDKTPLNKPHKTEYFLYEENQYRIEWEVKNVISIPHDRLIIWQLLGGDVNKYKLTNLKESIVKSIPQKFTSTLINITPYQRYYRLRLPFALELQQAFSSSITRVGLPVSPPFTQEVVIEVFFSQAPGLLDQIVEERRDYAFQPVISRKEDKVIRLTLSFAVRLKVALKEKQEKLTSDLLLTVSDSNEEKALKKNLDFIAKLLEKFDKWFIKSKGFACPLGKKPIEDVVNSYIGVSLNAPVTLVTPSPYVLFNIKSISPSIENSSPE